VAGFYKLTEKIDQNVSEREERTRRVDFKEALGPTIELIKINN